MKQGLMKTISSGAHHFTRFANAGSRLAFCLLIICGVFLFAGFIRFATIIAQYENSVEPSGDAIVVFTGDKSRIKTGLELLRRGNGKKLFISGVNHHTSVKALLSRYSSYAELFSCCIELDRIAKDTRQNGMETAKWVHRQGYDSLIVVTSDYHMPRSLMELSSAMPDILLLPYVARDPQSARNAAIDNSEHLRVMVREFIKTIASSLNRYD